MAALTRRRRLLALGGALFVAATPSMASASACVVQDLGPLSLCVPPTWTLTQGRTDSAAGRLTGDGLSLSYDFGLNSDPLRVPAEASQVEEARVTIDGLAARRVRYSMRLSDGVHMHYLGVHVPEVRRGSMGRLRLTLLASVRDPARFDEVNAALATIQIQREPAR